MRTPVPAAPTVGEIARRVGCAIHQVEYVIRSRDILPSHRAGNARLFSEDAVRLIAGEIRRINAEKGGVHGR